MSITHLDYLALVRRIEELEREVNSLKSRLNFLPGQWFGELDNEERLGRFRREGEGINPDPLIEDMNR